MATIEEGDNDLTSEDAIKFSITNLLNIRNSFFIESTAYHSHIDDYIFLQQQPDDSIRVTIRGVFPLALYRQTNAKISGLDVLLKWEPGNHWQWVGKYALVRGKDVTNNEFLSFMPADNIFSSIQYNVDMQKKLKHFEVQLNGSYVAKQNRFDETTELTDSPDSYFLLGARSEAHIKSKTNDIYVTLDVNNVLNTRYRDYLNRLRYFADEEGISLRLGVRYAF